jgi:membrane protein implicated in regulation of membrane protease activity
MLWQYPWVWIAGGIVLGLLEMLAPGFYLLAFAVGAVLTGGLIWLGLLGQSLPLMLFVTAAAAVVVWLVARRLAGVRAGQTRIWDRDINEN